MSERNSEGLPMNSPADGNIQAPVSDVRARLADEKPEPVVEHAQAANPAVAAEDLEYQRWARHRFGESASIMA